MSAAVARTRGRPGATLALVALVGGLLTVATPAVAADEVAFVDPDLRRAVNAAIAWGRDPDAPVTVAEAATVTSLWAVDAAIDDLGGIERLIALRDLTIDGNRVVDLGPLRSLPTLTTLSAGRNRIVDLRPLASLPNLAWASVWGQQVPLPALATTATQTNPLRAADGRRVMPYSDTAVVAVNGSSWRLREAGAHTLSWYDSDTLPSGASVSFDGEITQTATGPSQLTLTPTPTIRGTLRVGSEVTAVRGTWDDDVRFQYQWLADGTEITGATAKDFTITTAQRDRTLSVRVTGSKSGYAAAAVTSSVTRKVMIAPVPKISGRAVLGARLTLTRGSWTPGAQLKIQWFADKIAIPGATGTRLTVTSTQQGKVIVARVTGTKTGYAKVAVDSAGAAKVQLLTTGSRASVSAAYRKIIAPALRVSTGWTGSTSGCRLGSESAASRKATLDAVNAVRAFNQLDGVRLVTAWNTPALRNSLMMQARSEITHYPAKKGRCWSSSGATAAARSNLYLGTGMPVKGNQATGARAVVGYMDDPGPSNVVAGHRRWIIEPSLAAIGTGSTSMANTLTVMGVNGPVTSPHNAAPTWLEWPSAGWFPRQLDPEGLWSLSASDPGVDFRGATVTVRTASGTRLRVSTYPVVDGYGPNTLTFTVSGVRLPKGDATRSYVVTVKGIRGGAASTHRYTVKMFDPYG